MISEGYAGVLSVAAMTLDTVIAEDLLARADIFGRARQRIVIILAAHGDVMLYPVDGSRLSPAWRLDPASCEREQGHTLQ